MTALTEVAGETRTMARGLVFSRTDKGHKVSYALTLGAELGYETCHGEASLPLLRRLIGARHLVFSTLDDAYGIFFGVTVLRALLGRKTTGLFLRPQSCFGAVRPIQRVKRWAFALVRRLGLANTLVLIPFKLEPDYARIARNWVHDPEFWDLDGKLGGAALPGSALADQIRQAAGTRRILALPGTVLARKGLGLVVEMMETTPELTTRVLPVCAGRVPEGEAALAARFAELGGLLIDRMILDEELFSIYGTAHVIWCCYAPEYDQSSGVFGRALQTRAPVLLRRGAVLERFAVQEGLPALALPFDDPTAAAALVMTHWPQAAQSPERREVDIAGNRARKTRFLSLIRGKGEPR